MQFYLKNYKRIILIIYKTRIDVLALFNRTIVR